MRVLVATTAGSGHFGPMLPFARALAGAGHEVAVAAPASFATAVTRAGFAHLPFDDAPPDDLGRVFAALADVGAEEGNAIVAREVFGRIDTAAALPGMRTQVEAWRPDLVLREMSEFSSFLVAEEAGLPHAQVAIGLAEFEQRFVPFAEEPLVELGARNGLAPVWASPRLTLTPPSFEDPVQPGPSTTTRYRDGDAAAAPAGPLPDWWGGSDDPLVYATFGSVAAGFGLFPDLYRAVVAQLADLPVRALLTLGEAGDPEALAPLPPNVHVERWWPQADVMPHAAAMVGHGGFGTTLAGLVAGVPMVVVPLFADQWANARRVAALGAGAALEGGPAGVGGLAGALQGLLADGSALAAARRVADEVAGLPPAAAAVSLLEAVVAGGA